LGGTPASALFKEAEEQFNKKKTQKKREILQQAAMHSSFLYMLYDARKKKTGYKIIGGASCGQQ